MEVVSSMMMKKMLLACALIAVPFIAQAGEKPEGFWVNPVVKSAGKIHPVDAKSYLPSAKEQHKVVFAMSRPSPEDKVGKVNPALERVARTVNLYATAGVPVKNMKFVAVAYGGAIPLTFDNETYKSKFGVDNPNIPVIAELKKLGVDIVACAQALAEADVAVDLVNPDVTIALSALTSVTALQAKGYSLFPL